MARQYTIQELWGLINRIETAEQCRIADDFITKHFPHNPDGSRDVDTFNDMIESCYYRLDEILHSRHC